MSATFENQVVQAHRDELKRQRNRLLELIDTLRNLRRLTDRLRSEIRRGHTLSQKVPYAKNFSGPPIEADR